ncbi:oxidoreductase [Streptomyces oceani]|uniref:Oxidoreductase n=1 Tax=Streptomyces oceani TaxID=1075402 RepID=A0A1E7KF30_9ACTN|nr:oxidoreductase [Streptomyces oceani]OEV02532.1 oxidoreductase [Streptomyces oceani]
MLTREELTPPERQLWDAFPVGAAVDLRTGSPDDPEPDDVPVNGPDWGPERTVRAAVLTALLLGGQDERPGATAALSLAGARITGRLTLDGAEVRCLVELESCWFDERISLEGASTLAFAAQRCRIPGIWASAAHIGGRLNLRSSLLVEDHGNALVLVHTQIAGGLRLDGAQLLAPGGLALSAGGIQMTGAVICEQGFYANGEVSFAGGQFPGGLLLRGARLENPGGNALLADAINASTLRCSRGFESEGKIRLRGAQVADLMSFEGATLRGGGTVLLAVGVQAADLDLRFAVPPEGTVDLRNAYATWVRDWHGSWPRELRLEGFGYDAVPVDDDSRAGGARPRDEVRRRLDWLRRSPGYAPQPYEQLAGAYRRIGHDDDARQVLLAKQRHRRRILRPAGRVWGRLLDVTVGYGYRPWLAGLWLLALTLLGTLVFGTREPTAVKPGEEPRFNAFVYTLDLLVPIGGLGQREAWHWASGGAQWLAYALIGLGWLLTTAVLAGVTRTLARN